MRVTLDAGHYGKYNQSPVNKAFYESDFNWKITNYMKEYFKEKGVQVRLTRTNKNKDLDLFTRGFKSTNTDIFISNHANACNKENVDFPVVIRGFDEPATDKLALELAKEISKIIGTKQQGKTWTRKKENSSQEWYGVLRGAKSAGTNYRFIIEHGFYTNKHCANFLLNEDNIKKLAKAEVDIICKYFKVKENFPIGKKSHYVEVLQNNLNVRDFADWKCKPIFTVNKGEVFTVIKEVPAKNGNQNMYLLKSGLYITSNKKYVKDIYK